MFRKIKEFFRAGSINAEYLDRIDALEDALQKAEQRIVLLRLERDGFRKHQDVAETLKAKNESLMVKNDMLQNRVNALSKKLALLESLSIRFFYSRMDPTGNPLWDEFRLLLDVVHGRTSADMRKKLFKKIGAPIQEELRVIELSQEGLWTSTT